MIKKFRISLKNMTKIFKKGLSLLFLTLAVFALTVVGWQLMPVRLAQAADLIVDAKFLDVDGNGTVERIRWNMDEDVTACVYEAGDWGPDFIGALEISVTGLACGTGVDGRDATDLDILISANENQTSSSPQPSIYYSNTEDPLFNSVTLTSGPLSDGHHHVNATDGVAPKLLSAEFRDNDADGTIEIFRTTWSETVTMSGSTAADWTIAAGSSIDAVFSGAVNDAVAGDTIDIAVTAIAGKTSSTVAPTISYDNDDTNNSVIDASSNHNPAGTNMAVTLTDAAAPVIIDFYYYDTFDDVGYGQDGKIDQVLLDFSENVDASSVLSANDLIFTNVGDFTGAAFGSNGTDLITLSGSSAIINFGSEATAVTTRDTSGDLAISSQNDFYLTDGININNTLGPQDQAGFTDVAPPIIVSVFPEDSDTHVDRDSDLVITFSESMDTTFVEDVQFDVTPDPGAFSTSWNPDDPVVTLTHGTRFGCSSTIEITTDVVEIEAAFGAAIHLVDGLSIGDWSFRTDSCGSSGNGGSTSSSVTSTTPVITLTDLTDTTLIGGDEAELNWTTSGSGIDTVALYYSEDNGETYNQIAYNLNKSLEGYVWTVPYFNSEEVLLKVLAYDSGKAVLDEEVSGLLSIISETTEDNCGDCDSDTDTDTEDAYTYYDEKENRTVANDSDDIAPSPVTGEDETVSIVLAGQYIRSYYFDTIYYVDEYAVRHPFWDANTFFSYADSFDEVVWVTDATLPLLDLGDPMLPAVGVALIKVQTDPKVYAIDSDSVLRWIPDETTATALYGVDWADYVIDLESTIFARFTVGDDMTVDDWVYSEYMKTREELAALAR